MLPPANRLKRKKDIKRALAGRVGCKIGQLSFKTAANEDLAARFCFIVSKKISNKAVVRNRLKRRLRAAVNALLPRVRSGVDGVLIALPGIEGKNYQKIAESVEKILLESGWLGPKK